MFSTPTGGFGARPARAARAARAPEKIKTGGGAEKTDLPENGCVETSAAEVNHARLAVLHWYPYPT